MKKAILQVQIDPIYNQHKISRTFHHILDLYNLSEYCAKNFAKIVDADYVQINDCSFLPDKHPCFQRLKCFEMYQYDQILYLDSDAIVLPSCPNIFSLYENHDFCATMDLNWYSHSAYTKKVKDMVCKKYNSSANYLPFCSGVMLMSQKWLIKGKPLFPKYLEKFNNRGYYDQGVFNSIVVEMGESYTILPEDFGAWYKKGKHIIHLATNKKKNFNLTKFLTQNNLTIN